MFRPAPPIAHPPAQWTATGRAVAEASPRAYGQLLRVVEYTVAGHEEAGPIGLITTILDPGQAPAAELAAFYHERWEVEGVLDEIKVHQRGPDVVLRPGPVLSTSPSSSTPSPA